MSSLLFPDERPLEVNRELAVELGLASAIVYSASLKQRKLNLKDLHSSLPFYSYKTIARAMKKLMKAGLISRVDKTPEHLKEELLSRQDLKNMSCEWCNEKVMILQSHHYPVPRKNGGLETVNICPNCHYGFHYLETLVSGMEGEKR